MPLRMNAAMAGNESIEPKNSHADRLNVMLSPEASGRINHARRKISKARSSRKSYFPRFLPAIVRTTAPRTGRIYRYHIPYIPSGGIIGSLPILCAARLNPQKQNRTA